MAEWDPSTQATMMQEFTDVVCDHDGIGVAVIHCHLCCAIGDSIEVAVHSGTSISCNKVGKLVPSRAQLAKSHHKISRRLPVLKSEPSGNNTRRARLIPQY